ncbi:DUF2975 domain-containing protein [Flavobacterium pedocola]
MRKLNLLKTIVDYIWIMSILFYPVAIVVAIMMVIDKESIDIPVKIAGSEFLINSVGGKIAFLLGIVNFGLLLYALFHFKKLLANFKKLQIFETESYLLLKKTGQLVICSSLLHLAAETIGRVSENTVAIEFGFGPFLYLLSIGLFFVVLSEVFKIGKRIKEENELTV